MKVCTACRASSSPAEVRSLFQAEDWDNALIFGLAVAVGLTPQMLPMIVNANLSRSVRIMRAQKTAIRRMDAIQNLGSM